MTLVHASNQLECSKLLLELYFLVDGVACLGTERGIILFHSAPLSLLLLCPGGRNCFATPNLADSLGTSSSTAPPQCCLQTIRYPGYAMWLELRPKINETSAHVSRRLSGMWCLHSCRSYSFPHSLHLSKILLPDICRPNNSLSPA